MTTLRTHRTTILLGTLLFASLIFFLATFNGAKNSTAQAQELQEPILPLSPCVLERVTTRAFVLALENNHISQRELDRTLSREALRLYIRALDPRKMFFYQSDIDEFRSQYELRLNELIKQNPVDVEPAFVIYNRYLTRLKERVAIVREILAEPMDFTVQEYRVLDRLTDFTLDENVVREKGLQTFPRTTEEAREMWRKRLKHELLAMKTEAIIAAERRERDIAEGRTPEELDDRDPVQRLLQRYVSLQRRMLLEGRIDNADIRASVRQQANDEVMELFLGAIAGALDPHSNFMSPSTEASFHANMGGNFQGIGATLSSEDGFIVVRDVIPGSPAERAGIEQKDKIQGVGQGTDGRIEEVIDFNVRDAVRLIRGEKGTTVRLDVLPGGRGPSRIVEIVRDVITLEDQAAAYEIFEAGLKPNGMPYRIGFIELPSFYYDMEAARQRQPDVRSSAEDVRKILGQLVDAGVDAVVLDLRGNLGGALHEAIEISGFFLGQGSVVQVRSNANVAPQPRPAHNVNPGTAWTGPLVVLTNRSSASASEILAGAMQDYRRGLIIGDPTSHGKGSVQSLLNLRERLFAAMNLGSAKITIQGYYRPSGISPQAVGVEADIVLPSTSGAREGAREADLDNVLRFRPVDPAPGFAPRQFVTPRMIAELRERSSQRIAECAEFTRLQERIALLREVQDRRVTPLHFDTFMEEIRRFNTDEWEQEEMEETLSKGRKIERDFYVEEVLSITVDYLKTTRELGIAFPSERVIPPPSRPRGFFGFGF